MAFIATSIQNDLLKKYPEAPEVHPWAPLVPGPILIGLVRPRDKESMLSYFLGQ